MASAVLPRNAQYSQVSAPSRGRFGDPAGAGQAAERRPEMRVLRGELVEPPSLLRSVQPGPRADGEPDEERRGAVGHDLGLPCSGQARRRVLPHRFQRPVPPLRCRQRNQQRLLDQAGERGKDVDVIAAHRRGGLQREAAGEEGQSPQQHLLGSGAAPRIDGRAWRRGRLDR
jgi:hypothetical protein